MAKARSKKGVKTKARNGAAAERLAYPVRAAPSLQSEAQRMLLKLPPLTDAQRSAFSAQSPDARCDAMGTQTKSAAVHREALAFAHVIETTLAKHGAALRRYTPARLTFFLECIAELGAGREQQAAQKDAGAPARRALDHALARGSEVRRELLHALELLSGETEPYRSELDAARGKTTKPQDLAASLNDLARLGDTWLRRTDAESRALVAAIDFRRGDVDLAWSAAQSLEQAVARASGVRLSDARDTPIVNRVEGRVLLEMRYAMQVFAHAHENDRLVPRLAPGPGTKHVLAATRGKRPVTRVTIPAPASASPS